ncbi:ABC transporter ATP-binding protein [Streptococcus sp. NLN64]|uniref:ATP-binding cassette domain-containing protein n=1 Tax=Streptococcus sp. NLN64 TaxID=2822799 RepID=UPI0018C9060C|nr:ABC transporter ATP-binding protein [Streptococcus sp. NLN64]MBG9368115.1 ABC transporter ATP-binding protein [Streptococcus sp. NLN64]
MENVLTIKDLSKRFGQQSVLNNVTLTIKKGEIYGLIGKNGAGKTTLIKVFTQLIQANQGNISLFGSQTTQEWTKTLGRIGSVIETPVAHNHLSARQNLIYYCKARHIPNAEEVADEVLTYVGLADVGPKKFKSFSLGMKQRFGIALALIGKPDFLILDEPINGLDPLAIKEFRQLIKRLNEEQGITMLISSHILSELYQVGNRFAIIEQGQIISEVSKAKFDAQSQDYIILKTPQIAEASLVLKDTLQLQIKVMESNEAIHIFGQSELIKDITRILVNENIDIDEIYYKRQNLEHYFTQLVK